MLAHCSEEPVRRNITRESVLNVDRLATLGAIASGVGHELRNVLTILDATIFYLGEKARNGDPPDERDMKNLERVAAHFATHAKQLQAMSGPSSDCIERLDLREILTGVLGMLRLSGKTKYVQIQSILPTEEIPVLVSRTRVEQIFINLIANAVDAIKEAGQLDGKVKISVWFNASQGRACCSIEDNGAGIDLDKLERVFEPYFTTKPQGKGTGLGLAVVRDIVESYGGSIAASSSERGGAVFVFDLPAE